MPRIPPDQQPNAPPPRGPHDHDTRPHGRTKHQPAAQRDNQSGEAASPHQRHGDRGGDDDNASAAHRALPTFVRYADLVAAGIVANWTTLLRLIDTEGFPVGIMIGANTRAWRADEVEAWLASRPSARKVLPPGATPHRHNRDAADVASNPPE
jgi:hypothetical protein